MPATIKDVARLAGVSASTASLALNNRPPVSKKTKAKVLKAAQMLDYYPNVIARGLAKRKTNNLALVIPQIAGYIFFSPYFVCSVFCLVSDFIVSGFVLVYSAWIPVFFKGKLLNSIPAFTL